MSQSLEALVVELRADVKGLQSSLQSAAADVSRFSSKAESSIDGFQASIMRARTAILSMAVAYAAISVGRGIIDAGMQMQAMQNKMLAATGSAAVAADSLAFVREEAGRLGISIQTATDGFSGFAASSLRAGLTLQQTKDIFTGVSEAAVSMRLPTEQVGLIFKALEQMAGKGVVAMEELRGQLGDALPGAFEIAAKAMGKTTAEFSKMVANGQVMSADFLPKFGAAVRKELGGSVDEASQGAQAAFNRLGNAFFELQTKMADAGPMDVVTTATNDLTMLLNNPSTVEGLKGFAGMLADIATSALSAAAALGTFYTKATSAIEKAGDSAFGAVFGDEGTKAIALARKAKANGVSMDSQKAVDDYMAAGGLRAGGGAANGEGLTTEGGYAAGSGPVDPNYTRGKIPTPGETDAQKRAREKAARERAQLREKVQGIAITNAGETDPAKQAALEADKQQKVLDEALAKKAISEQEYRDASLQNEMAYQDKLTDIRQKANDLEVGMRDKTLNSIQALIQVFAGKNKAVAIAMLAFDKARAIAQAIIETHVAAAAALKYDPTGATSAYVTTLGYANVAAIAATGIAQLATMGSGGGGGSSSSSSGGTSGGSGSSDSSATGDSSSAPTTSKSVYITLNGDDAAYYSKTNIRKLIETINDAISDGSQLKVAVSS